MKKYYYSLNIEDENGHPIAPFILTDDELIDLSDRIANGSWSGSMEFEEETKNEDDE